MSLTWAESPHAHAAQTYLESGDLADSVAAYVAAGFDVGEPAALVATVEHARLVSARLAACGWNERQVEELGLLVVADAELTLGRIMDGVHPSAFAFERVIGSILDELALRFPGRRVRAFGEMVNVLCERGERKAAVELEELWNRLARTRDFTLLCGYRVDVFDRASQIETLADVCRLHTHVTLGPDTEKLAHAVDDALASVLGTPGAGQVYSLLGAKIRERRIPAPQLVLMWVSQNMPLSAERILASARRRYRDAPATPTRASSFGAATLRPDGAWRAMLRKATRTRRLT